MFTLYLTTSLYLFNGLHPYLIASSLFRYFRLRGCISVFLAVGNVYLRTSFLLTSSLIHTISQRLLMNLAHLSLLFAYQYIFGDGFDWFKICFLGALSRHVTQN